MDAQEPMVAVTDPGEVGRAEHNKGDRAIVRISNVFSWLFPILMIIISLQVVLRNAGKYDIGPGNQAWMDDLQWWFYGAAVLIGIGYAVTTNSHVRVDIFYDNYSKEKQAKIDVFALSWLFLPFVMLCWDSTLNFAIGSVIADEGSSSPNGLHNQWILKLFMNASFVFIAYATWAAYVRRLSVFATPSVYNKLLFAFPAVWFLVDLVIYYAAFIAGWIMAEEGTTTRQITRMEFFKEFEYGPFETSKIVVIAGILTILMIVAARFLQSKKEA